MTATVTTSPGRYAGKVAVITGAGSGIGREIARGVARTGGRVVCLDRNGSEDEIAGELGDAAIAVRGDVARAADVERAIGTAEERFGRLDVVFNNAGFGGPMMPLADQTEENFDLVHSVNLKGVFFGMKYGIAALLRGEAARSSTSRRRPVSSVGRVTASTPPPRRASCS